jgi:HSP20 family protein
MERSISKPKRPWWMTSGGREPAGDVWFDRMWPDWPRSWGEKYIPIFDMYEKNGHYVVKGELPGIDKDDISIDIDNDVVTISGKMESKHEEKDTNCYLKESRYGSSRYGSFSRSFRSPDDVQEDQVEATMEEGVLNVVMPIKKFPKARKIEIRS